jgi:hypothetical protein
MPRIDLLRLLATALRLLVLFAPCALLVLPALVLPLGGCGESAPGCTPGQSIACAGNGCTGYQVCNSDGKAYGACTCGEPVDPAFPTVGPNSGLIGAACTSAANCHKGFDCLTADSTLLEGQGPSAGICLAKCLPEHDFCKDLDARSKCIVLSDRGTPSDTLDDISYCLPGCKLGTQANELDKCRSRRDLVCSESPAGSGVGFCRPACRSDLDCAGRSCDLSTGLCGDSEPVGSPIGAACDPESETSTCAGACLPHTASYAECSGVCSFGTPGCGQVSTKLPLENFCLVSPTTGAGDGDLGYCSKLCDCDKDCGRADAVCEPKPNLMSKTGRSGVCGSKTFTSGALRGNTPC